MPPSYSPDRLLTEIRVVPLVKEEFRPNSLHNNVPGVHRARAAHQCGQDGVSGKHIALRFCQLQGGRETENEVRTLRSPGRKKTP